MEVFIADISGKAIITKEADFPSDLLHENGRRYKKAKLGRCKNCNVRCLSKKSKTRQP